MRKIRRFKITEEQLKLYLAEALSPSVAKEYMNIKRDDGAEVGLNNMWDAILKAYPNIKTSKRQDRLYIPYIESETTNNDIDVNNNKLHREISDVLNRGGFIIDDYKSGLALDVKYNRKVKIGGILNKLKRQDLLDAFADDPIRSSGKQNERFIVLSKHPYDIAGMSTDRGWSSCMNIQGGSYSNYVDNDIKFGTIIAYLINANDININKPIGRVLIKPYIGAGDNNIIYRVCNGVYGTVPNGFTNQLIVLFQKLSFKNAPDGKYKHHDRLYSDGDIDSIDKFDYNTIRDVTSMSNEERIANVLFWHGKIGIVKAYVEGIQAYRFSLINKNGEFRHKDKWYIEIKPFGEHFLKLDYYREYNLIDKNGRILYKKWFELIEDLRDGVARVIFENNMENVINEQGELISQTWSKHIRTYPNSNVFMVIGGDSRYNLMDKKGDILYEDNFVNIEKFQDNEEIPYFIIKHENGKYNISDKNGNLLYDTWYDIIEPSKHDLVMVRVNKKSNFLNLHTKKPLLNKWCDGAFSFVISGFAVIRIDKKYNVIDTNGKVLFDTWFDSADSSDYRGITLTKDGRLYVLLDNGTLEDLTI